MDAAEAYENHAREFLAVRDRSSTGAEVVRRWAGSLRPGSEVLELACGGGLPVTRELVDAGLNVWAIDSSKTLLAEFEARFPGVPVRRQRVQESDGFSRRFDAVIAVGILFLLDEADQKRLIARVQEMLLPGGRFLFSAPLETGRWNDLTTGIESLSLGQEAYEAALAGAGLRLVDRYRDEGNGNYYDAERAPD